MKNGVPYDVAFSLPTADMAAYGIIFSEFEGNEFDFERMRYKDKK